MSKINNAGGSGGGLAAFARAIFNFFRGRRTRAPHADEHDTIPQRTQTRQTQATRSNEPASLSERNVEHGNGTSKKRGGLASVIRAILNFFRGRAARPNEPRSPSTQETEIGNLPPNEPTSLFTQETEIGDRAPNEPTSLFTQETEIGHLLPHGQSNRSKLKIDRSFISETEVNAIMPHLLSPDLELNSKLAGSTQADIMQTKIKADILQAKIDAIAELKNLSTSENGLTRDELQVLNNHIYSPAAINQKIKDNRVEKLRGNDKYQYEQMMSGLNKLSDYQGIVYRSVMMSPKNMRKFKHKVGGVVSSDAFISTSISPNMSKAYSDNEVPSDNTGDIKLRYQMIQHSGKNIFGLNAALAMENDPGFEPDFNLDDGTKEILIKPNTRFRLVALDKHPSDNIYGAILKEVDSPKPSDNVRDSQGVLVEQKPASTKDLTDDFDNVRDRQNVLSEKKPASTKVFYDEFGEVIDSKQGTVDASKKSKKQKQVITTTDL